MSLFSEDIFGGEELAPQLIEVECDQETAIKFEPIAVRAAKALKEVQTYHDMIEIIETDEQLGKINIRYTPEAKPKQSFVDYLRKVTDEKSEIRCNDKEYIVPTLKPSEVKIFKEVIEKQTANILEDIEQIGELIKIPNKTEITDEVKKRTDRISKVSKLRLDKVQKGFLTLQELDYLKHELMDDVAKTFDAEHMYFDPLTSGTAIIEQSKQLTARERPLTQRYRLTEKQATLLKRMIFSRSPRVRLASKLDLYSQLCDRTLADVKANPRMVLAMSIAEVQPSKLEILAFTFSDNEKENTCMCCGTTVEVSERSTFHQKCEMVEWLEEYFFFKYDEQARSVDAINVLYLSQRQTAILQRIEKVTKQVTTPIKYKSSSKFLIMEKNHGRYVNKVSLSPDPSTVVGSEAWLRNQRSHER